MTAELLDYAGDGGAKDELEVASSVGVAVAWSSYHSFRFVPPNALASGNKRALALQDPASLLRETGSIRGADVPRRLIRYMPRQSISSGKIRRASFGSPVVSVEWMFRVYAG